MAIDDKYGTIEIPGIPADEPVFVLRSQDALALPTILHYQMLVTGLRRTDDRMVDGLRRVITRFAKRDGKKLPD